MKISRGLSQLLATGSVAILLGVFIAVALAASLAAGGFAYYRYQYPYGRSHCCDKQLVTLLLHYSDSHQGWFPRGESCPEASLSLLHRTFPNTDMADLLRGKIVPEKTVKARLSAGQLLTPSTCGWHYVEGLRPTDDHRLALFWDKVGLGHNGERLKGGGHFVAFVSGNIEYIDGDHWDAFLQEQEQLHMNLQRLPAER